MNNVYAVAFWTAIVAVLIAGAMGVSGIWIKQTETGWKLFWTDVVVAVTAVFATLILKWLSRG